ncbi:MAG: hypothetical protein JSS32_01405 [Verrucomicrobia bacterium]|nr:hypothetical protein [Verrucomicrobiota bacterium]
MSTWIEQLSSWMEKQEPLPELEQDGTISRIETLIHLSDEIQETYSQVVEKLDHERSHASP